MSLWKRRPPQLPATLFEPGGPVQTRLLRIVAVVCVIGALPGFRLWQVYSLCMAPLEVSAQTTRVGGSAFNDFRAAGREAITQTSGPVNTWMTAHAALELVGGEAWQALPGEPLSCAEPWSSEAQPEREAVVKARVDALAQRWTNTAEPFGVDIHQGEPRSTDPTATLRVARALSCRALDTSVDMGQAMNAVRLGFQTSALLGQSSNAAMRQLGSQVREQIAGTALRRACKDVTFRGALTSLTDLPAMLDVRDHLLLTRLSMLPTLIETLKREAAHAPPSININALLRQVNAPFDEAELALEKADHPRAAIEAVNAIAVRQQQRVAGYAERNGLLSALWDPERAVLERSKYKADTIAAAHLAGIPARLKEYARAAYLTRLVAQLSTAPETVCALAATEP